MSIVTRARSFVSVAPTDIAGDHCNLAPSVVRYGLKLSLVEGMVAQAHITISAGAFLTGFALLLGAGNLTLGIVGAMPFLIQPLQLLGAWLIERVGRRKPLTVIGSLGRTLWLVLLLLPYLPLTTTQRLLLMVGTLFVAQAMLALCSNAWTNWMTDLVPPRQRGRYFGLRSTAMAAVAMVVSAGAGYVLDGMRASGRDADGYALIYGFAVLAGAISTLMVSRQPEPSMTQRARVRLGDLIPVTMRSPEFRRFLGAMAVWNAALGISAPFFSAYGLQELHMPFTMLAAMDIVTAGVSLLTLSFWGQLSDRIGQRRVMLLCMVGVLILPWFWVVATPTTLWLLFVNAVISGIFWPGIGIAQPNRLMEQAPANGRGIYLAMFGAVTGLAYFGASTFGGVLADALTSVHWSLGPLEMGTYQPLFIGSSLLRASVVLFMRKAL